VDGLTCSRPSSETTWGPGLDGQIYDSDRSFVSNTGIIEFLSVKSVKRQSGNNCQQSLRVSRKQNNLDANLARIKNLEVKRRITRCYDEGRVTLQRKSQNEAHNSCCMLQEIICSCLIYEDSLFSTFVGRCLLSVFVIHIYDIFIAGVDVYEVIIYHTVIKNVSGDVK
jgi:hypothetical protein